MREKGITKMAFSFDRRGQVNPDQARIDENRARMAQESKIISGVGALLRQGVTIEEAVSQVEGASVEQINEWLAEGRMIDPKYYDRPYRATDEDLH